MSKSSSGPAHTTQTSSNERLRDDVDLLAAAHRDMLNIEAIVVAGELPPTDKASLIEKLYDNLEEMRPARL